MRYLVTGGAGFIGSHLVEYLISSAHDVVVLDNLSTGRPGNLAAVRHAVRFIRGSITDPAACRRAVEGIDCVLHQAAMTSVHRSVDEPILCHDVNAGGTINLLAAARNAGVRRLVYASSTSAYGDGLGLPNSEDQLTRPLSPYAASKLAAEQYCQAFQATGGLETVVLRYFNIFGPRQNPHAPDAAVVPRFISAALRGRRPVIYGDGRQTRDFLYVTNVVRANLLASRAPASRVAGEVVNVGCGRSVSVNELWSKVRELTGARLDPEYRPGRVGDVRDSLASVEKARELIDYEPVVDFEAGLQRTVAYYRSVGRLSRRPLGRASPAALPG